MKPHARFMSSDVVVRFMTRVWTSSRYLDQPVGTARLHHLVLWDPYSLFKSNVVRVSVTSPVAQGHPHEALAVVRDEGPALHCVRRVRVVVGRGTSVCHRSHPVVRDCLLGRRYRLPDRQRPERQSYRMGVVLHVRMASHRSTWTPLLSSCDTEMGLRRMLSGVSSSWRLHCFVPHHEAVMGL